MQFMRRSRSLSRLPHRQAWHNLSAYTTTPSAVTAWKQLRLRDQHVQSVVAREDTHKHKTAAAAAGVGGVGGVGGDGVCGVNWEYWDKQIGHKEIVKCMKAFYEQQVSLLQTARSSDHAQIVKSQQKGWELYDSALTKCDKSVEDSEQLVANGARGLWVSYNNPPVTQVDDNEWLDSDRHWQAVVEKQFFYNPTASIAEEELPKWREVSHVYTCVVS
eukprot:GHVQ01019044.1.p1 GENE.GHVQ01019044.1~~GHVQ01019044.1.p1  ORF type:complete len:217 (+),score=54.72 GHVQ01019044.1:188-838(+)